MKKKALSSFKVVVFDFDGTLIDSMSSLTQIGAGVMSRHYQCDPLWAQEKYLLTSGLPFALQIESLFPDDPRNKDAVRAFNEQKRLAYVHCSFFADVLPALAWLGQQRLKIAISSNNDETYILNQLKANAALFHCILGYRPGFKKGADHFEYLQKDFDVKRDEIIFVGDSLNDAILAQNCGIAFVARLGTFGEDDFRRQNLHMDMLTSLEEIKKYIPCR